MVCTYGPYIDATQAGGFFLDFCGAMFALEVGLLVSGVALAVSHRAAAWRLCTASAVLGLPATLMLWAFLSWAAEWTPPYSFRVGLGPWPTLAGFTLALIGCILATRR